MQLSCIPNDRNRYRHSVRDNSTFCSPPQRRSEIVFQCRRGPQRIKCCAAFRNRLFEPTGELSQCTVHLFQIQWFLETIIDDEFAALNRLKERIVEFSCHARALRQSLADVENRCVGFIGALRAERRDQLGQRVTGACHESSQCPARFR